MRPRGVTTKIIIFCLAGIFGAAWLTSDEPRADRAVIGFSEKETAGPGRTDVVFQDRINNCGAATLKMILDHFGHPVSIRDLERRIAPSNGGTSLHRLREVAYEFGVQTNAWRLTWDNLARIQYPVIMFFRENHFVVADSLDASGFLLVRDPAIGTRKLSQQALMDNWGGETLVFSCSQPENTSTMKTAEGK